MTISSQLLLTFLLNAVWQVALIAALASFCAWLLRDSAMRYQHWVWVAALCLSVVVPTSTTYTTLPSQVFSAPSELSITNPVPLSFSKIPFPLEETPATSSNSAFQLNSEFALALLTVFAALLLFRSVRLVQAWFTTRKIRNSALNFDPDERIERIVLECERVLNLQPGRVKVYPSKSIPVPVTIGLFRPVIILPEALVRGGDEELLTSAIGHELIHVARHDYVLNFLYELLYLPVSFHPAAALVRRRIKQTRELCCDELVAERILNAQVYARSLVALASSAPPLRRLSVTTTVGIADADILEARIMSLLSKPKMNRRWKKLLLLAVAVLLLVPSFAAAAFAMRFELAPNVQEPAQQEKEAGEKRKTEEMRERTLYTATERSGQVREEIKRKQEVEMEMQATLVRLARLTMDQAIQIATTQYPGKVLVCSLEARGWEEPGKLGKDGVVFYHVMIADETGPGASTHVWVNAVDGSIIKTEKELPRKRSAENQ